MQLQQKTRHVLCIRWLGRLALAAHTAQTTQQQQPLQHMQIQPQNY
jgi:hypothetical protein